MEFLVFYTSILLVAKQFSNRPPLYICINLIISSFGKLLLILMVIWDYPPVQFSMLIRGFVFASNLLALSGV
jgi:hypothetical protein